MSPMRRVLELHRASYARNPFGVRIAVVMALDFVCLLVAGLAARHWADPPVSNATFAMATAIVAVGALLVLHVTGAYDLATIRSSALTRISLLVSLGIAFVVTVLFYFAVPLPDAQDALLTAAAVFLPLFLIERKIFRSVSKRMRNRILLVGVSDLALSLAR